MPIHDWVPVQDVFHHFHQRWAGEICDVLNDGLLPSGYSALVEPPKTRHVIQTKEGTQVARANRVAIRHRMGEVVCVIEIVSPDNKSSENALKAFVKKTIEFLEHGVHLLVLDLFPPSKRDPQGIHKAIWDQIEERDFTLPPDKPLTLAAYMAGDSVAGIETTAYVEPVGVGDVLPDMPA